MKLNRTTVIQVASKFGLTGLLSLIAAAPSYRASLDERARTVGLNRHTLSRHLSALADAGYVRPDGRLQDVAQGGLVEFSRDSLAQNGEMHAALALLVLIRCLADEAGTFIIANETLCELAACSEPTLRAHIRTLEERKFVERKRVGRSDYAVTVRVPVGAPTRQKRELCASVPAGTRKKPAKVRPAYSLTSLQERARQLLARLGR